MSNTTINYGLNDINMFANIYQLDIRREDNGVFTEHTYKSPDIGRLIKAAGEYPNRRPETVWVIWKEFVETGICRHLVSVTPSSYKDDYDIYRLALRKDREIDEPIPESKPHIEWV